MVASVGVLLLFGPATERAWAQAGALGNIMGKASDETGGLLPGVTVTATSPALQVPNVTAVTDAEGNYRLRDLPAPGMYRIVFELTGFQTIAFDGVSLTAGFTARIDAAMKVSAVSETVEVSGQSPVVDTVSVAGVSSIPAGANRIRSASGWVFRTCSRLAAGVSLAGVRRRRRQPDGQPAAHVTYGVALTPTLEFEGINSTTARQGNTALYLNDFQVEEASFKTTGNNADVAVGGVYQQLVMKSGGNMFHGSGQGSYENDSWQSNNVSEELAREGFHDHQPDHPLLGLEWRSRGLHFQKQTLVLWRREQAGNSTSCKSGSWRVPIPGCWTCPDAPPVNSSGFWTRQYSKVLWQISSADRVIGTFHGPRRNRRSSAPAPPHRRQPRECRVNRRGRGRSGVRTRPNNLFIDSVFGFCCYWTHYFPQPGTAVAGNPASQEITNNMLTGPLGAIPGTVSERHQARSSVELLGRATPAEGRGRPQLGTAGFHPSKRISQRQLHINVQSRESRRSSEPTTRRHCRSTSNTIRPCS